MRSLKALKPQLQLDFSQNIKRVGQHIYITPKNEHTHTFIWMHGLEDIPDNFLAGFNNPELTPFNQSTKVILLCAPVRALTKNKGEKMTSWYDIKSADWKDHWGKKTDNELWGVDEALESRDLVWSIIEEETIAPDKIFIGGFSQGCCISLLAGLGYKYTLGGILAHSGYLFPFTEFKNQTPILICHGADDLVIPLAFAQRTYEPLSKLKNELNLFVLQGVEHAMMLDNFKYMSQFVQIHGIK